MYRKPLDSNFCPVFIFTSCRASAVRVRNVHLRLERAHGTGMSAPAFAVGFVLPSASTSCTKTDK